jgi:hypothetical protein
VDVFALSDGTRAFYCAAAFRAAEELGVFAALPCDDATLAARLGVAPRRLQALLDVLRLEGLFTSSPRRPPGNVPAEGWGRLAEVIRTNRPLDAAAHLGEFHAHLAEAGADPARTLAERLVTLGPTLVDLGGGFGIYARAFAARGGAAIIVDREEVLARAPAADNVRFVAGDLFTADLPTASTALLCNVLHLYGEPDCARLVARAATIAPHVVVKDLDPRTPAGAYFSLNMALYTEAGRVHSHETIAAWLAEAGLTVETSSLGEHLLLIGSTHA